MMMEADVERGVRGAVQVLEERPAARGVALHQPVFVSGERTGLAQHLFGHRHLADIMEQPRRGCLPRLRLVEVDGAAQVQHQRADRDRVQVVILVLALQSDEPDQRRAVARKRSCDLVDERRHRLQIDGTAEPRRAEDALHFALGATEDEPGLGHLLARRNARPA